MRPIPTSITAIRRAASTSSSSLTPSFTHAGPIPNRSVLQVKGKDAASFLAGISAVKILDHRPFYASFLHAQGRILFDAHIYPHPSTSSFLIDHDSRPPPTTHPATLQETMRKFVLRSKVGLKDVSAEWESWACWTPPPPGVAPAHCATPDGGRAWFDQEESLWGGKRNWKWGNGGSAGPVWEKEPERLKGPRDDDVEVGGWDLRAPGMGWRGLVRKGETPSLAPTSSSTSTTPSTPTSLLIPPPPEYTLHRLSLGVPEGIDELVPMSALPSESNLDFMGGVDFRKGCYIGQELTVRTYHTGMTRKRIVPITLHPVPETTTTITKTMTTSPSTGLSSSSSISADDGSSDLSSIGSSTPTTTTSTSTTLPFLPLPSTDIRLTPLSSPSSSSSSIPARGKSSGRLITCTSSGHGLALLRLEQCEAVWAGKGEMSLVLASAGPGATAAAGGGVGTEESGDEASVGGGSGGGGGRKVRVVPWKVGWWPVQEAEK